MTLDLTPADLQVVAGLTPPKAVSRLLTDPAGPLADAAFDEDAAKVAYILARVYRRALRPRSDGGGILHGKPPYEAEALFAQRVRSSLHQATGPADLTVRLSRALGFSWDRMGEADRLWWHARVPELTAGTSRLTTPWSLLRDPARLQDVLTAAMVAAGWLYAIDQAGKHPDHTPAPSAMEG